MYEKPQYFTNKGFKRLAKNPHKNPEIEKELNQLYKKKVSEIAPKSGTGPKGMTISDEAARLIADVFKGLLNSPRNRHR